MSQSIVVLVLLLACVASITAVTPSCTAGPGFAYEPALFGCVQQSVPLQMNNTNISTAFCTQTCFCPPPYTNYSGICYGQCPPGYTSTEYYCLGTYTFVPQGTNGVNLFCPSGYMLRPVTGSGGTTYVCTVIPIHCSGLCQ